MDDFQKLQSDFVQHIKRQGHHPVGDNIEDRRMKIYRELFFNNIKGFVDSAFPVLKSLYSEDKWNALIRQFFAEHSCRSPYFVEISKEFVEFISNQYIPTDEDPGFLKYLAHYDVVGVRCQC